MKKNIVKLAEEYNIKKKHAYELLDECCDDYKKLIDPVKRIDSSECATLCKQNGYCVVNVVCIPLRIDMDDVALPYENVRYCVNYRNERTRKCKGCARYEDHVKYCKSSNRYYRAQQALNKYSFIVKLVAFFQKNK